MLLILILHFFPVSLATLLCMCDRAFAHNTFRGQTHRFSTAGVSHLGLNTSTVVREYKFSPRTADLSLYMYIPL